MALVRRTKKLQEEIDKSLKNIQIQKFEMFLQRPEFETKIIDFIKSCLRVNLIVPDIWQAWMEQQTFADLNSLMGFEPLKVKISVISPQHPDGYYDGYETIVNHSFHIENMIFPTFKKSPLTLISEDKQIVFAYTDNDLSDTNPRVNITFKVPRIVFESSPQEDKTYAYQIMEEPKKLMIPGHFENALSSDQLKEALPINIREGMKDSELPSVITQEFNLFQDDLKSIRKVSDRLNKTSIYIFGEIWKLPSLNKMVEFFPALRAFLSDELLERLNKGAQRKKLYNVALPDADVVASATEASIK